MKKFSRIPTTNLSRYILLASILIFLSFYCVPSMAQEGSVDQTFNIIDKGMGVGDGPEFGTVFASVKQQDGKYMVAGSFSAFNGLPSYYLARLHSNGQIDSSFTMPFTSNGSILSIGVQSDGKIIVGGSFTIFAGSSINRIARLNQNGTLDLTFNIGTGFNANVTKIIVQPDNKILVAGSFSVFNSISRNKICRLNSDGTNDISFAPSNTTINGDIHAMKLQSNGMILIGGSFTSLNGNTSLVRIARLLSNGTNDPGFTLSGGASDIVSTISVQPDGKIFIGGEFGSVNGVINYRAARLLSNGTLDITFSKSSPWTDRVISCEIQPDGKILVGLNYYSNTLNPGSSLLRLNSNGTIDPSFTIGLGANGAVSYIALDSSLNIFISGNFNTFNTCAMKNIALINPSGSCDAVFMQAGGANLDVVSMAVQSDDKIIISGVFNGYNGVLSNCIARTLPDGQIDTTFKTGSGFKGGSVNKVVVQPDQKIIVGGTFTTYNDTVAKGLIRLLPNGTIDPTFSTGTGLTSSFTFASVKALLVEPNGKIIVGGTFSNYNGNLALNAMRINADGSFANSFNFSGTSNVVQAVVRQPDGKLIFSGGFSGYQSTSRNCLARINVDGTIDNTFTIGSGFNSSVTAIILLPTGHVVAGGQFSSFNGNTSLAYLIRLTSTGSYDGNYGSFNNYVNTLYLQPNGKFVVGGKFTLISGVTRNRLARFLPSGLIDGSFVGNIPTNPFPFSFAMVNHITAQSDGKLLVGGDFVKIGNVGKNRIARIYSSCVSANTPTIVATTSTICQGNATTLSIGSGVLIDSKKWYWYKNGCGSTLVDSGVSITVSPSTTTTYYVRGEGGCAANGNCGSKTINVISQASLHTSNNINTCTNYTWNGNTYTASGVYQATFTSVSGCDSVHTINLTINSHVYSVSNISSSNFYTWLQNGLTYTSSGTYTHTAMNTASCIDTFVLNLTIFPTPISSINTFEDQSISCYGFNDGSCQTLASPGGNYTYTLDGGTQSNSTGSFNSLSPGTHTVCASDGINIICDTVFINEPANLSIQFVTDSLVSCYGNDGAISAVITGGTNLLQGYLTLWENSNGDTINNLLTNNFDLSVNHLSAGSYNLTVEDDHGCFRTDSFILNNAPPLQITATYSPIICNGNSTSVSVSTTGGFGSITTLINGSSILPTYTAGIYTITATDTKGCTSQVILNISEPALLHSNLSISSCDTYTWLQNGSTYTSSGIYLSTYSNTSGCIGVDSLQLTINESKQLDEYISSVESYTWPITNSTYTVSGVYSASFITTSGCDSIHILHLTIKGIAISPKVFLSGAYDMSTGLMHDSLRVLNLIPQTEPYSYPPYNKMPIGGLGSEMLSPSLLAITGNNAIVDWVLVEVRSALNPAIVLANKRALLQRDGDIVNHINGNPVLYFDSLLQGNYFISVKHRNHLGVMTAASISLNYTPTNIDFRSSIPVYVVPSIQFNSPRKLVGTNYLLWAGDANNNKNIKYNGLANDKEPILNSVGLSTPNNSVLGYRVEDINLDGKVKYNNVDNDKNFILLQLGVTPNAVFHQHMTD